MAAVRVCVQVCVCERETLVKGDLFPEPRTQDLLPAGCRDRRVQQERALRARRKADELQLGRSILPWKG